MSTTDIDNRFATHHVSSTTVEKMADLREEFKTLAHVIDESIPDGREKSLTMTKLEEAMFFANAALSRKPGNQI